jgi:hypothetical protein
MAMRRFEVKIEGGPVIRSNDDVTSGMSGTTYRFRVIPLTSVGEACFMQREFPIKKASDVELLNQAERLHRAGSAVVDVSTEWLAQHATTWRERVIDLALEQYATRPLQSEPEHRAM